MPPLALNFLLIILAGMQIVVAPAAGAQAPQSLVVDPAQDRPRVFVESSDFDQAALQAELPFVIPVEDKSRAQVWIVVETGPSDTRVRFTGLAEFDQKNLLITCPALPGESAAEKKARVLQTIKLGLLKYVSKTPAASLVEVRLLDAVKPTAVVDPWKFWVFSAGVNAFVNGEKSYKSQMWFGNFSANRVTPEWKIRLGLNGSFNTNTYTIGDYAYNSQSNSKGLSGLVAKSLGEHWSVGAFLQISSATYDNTAWSVMPAPAVEYNLFPYSQSTQKQLRFLYTLGPKLVRYREVTVYDKLKQTLLSENLSASLDLTQPWGTISASLEGSHYFHDFKKYRLELFGAVSVRLFRGLNINFQGGGSRIHDQLSLPQGGASLEEVLLQRKQLETGYNYYFSAGFSYSFGSIFSKVINPRFGNGGGFSMNISM